MNDHKIAEQQDAWTKAKQWSAVAWSCNAAVMLLPAVSSMVDRPLARWLGVHEIWLGVASVALAVVWLVVMAHAHGRASEHRCAARGQKHWKQQKKEFAEELAQAEAFLGIER